MLLWVGLLGTAVVDFVDQLSIDLVCRCHSLQADVGFRVQGLCLCELLLLADSNDPVDWQRCFVVSLVARLSVTKVGLAFCDFA